MYVTHIRMQYMQCFNLSIQIYVLFFTYQYLYKIFDFDEKKQFHKLRNDRTRLF